MILENPRESGAEVMAVSEGVMQEYDYMNEYWEASHRKEENMRVGHPNIWLRTTEIYRG